MKLLNNSGPAIFMYLIISLTLVISTICFVLYYGNFYQNIVILWIGITTFTIMYHLWGRIIMGNVSKIFKKYIDYEKYWFKEKHFEKKLYQILKVKKWKGKALTYNPELFDLKKNTFDEIANSMTKAELDHWINEIISLTTILFGFIWGKTWIFALTAILAMIFDGQFIIIQRYNRPRILRIIKNKKEKDKKKVQI